LSSNRILDNILAAIGNTPIVRLNRLSLEITGEIFAKLEFMNPGGSVKDRIAPLMISDAERHGLLRKGDTIIEPSSGNTGVGLAQVAAIKGYKMIVTMPDKVTEEKRTRLKAYGAKIVLAPSNVPPESPENYINVARNLNQKIKHSFVPNQYYNKMNPLAHYKTTGPEIWKQTGGEVDVLVAGIGTGGTITGAGKFLKKKKDIMVVGVDPEGSMYYNLKYGTDFPIQPYAVEGIGEDFLPGTYDTEVVDELVRVSDAESFRMARRLALEEGILIGGSGGTVASGALKFANERGKKEKIVVILPDSGQNYLSKLFNDGWMRENGFL
jgi:cystathionine beta-synthase